MEDFTTELDKARLELAKFLKENPHLISFQNKLEKDMNRSNDRLEVLNFYIQDNLEQLKIELLMLQYKIDSILK